MDTEATGWVPVDACALPTEEQPLRLAEFDALFGSALCRTDRRDATWLRLALVAADGHFERASELTARETACCSFFAFDVHRAGPEILIDVRVPAERAAVLDGLHRQAIAAAAGRIPDEAR